MYKLIVLIVGILFFSCQAVEEPITDGPYFPGINSNTWATTEPIDLDWNESELSNLKTFLEEKNTRAFIILKDGKIVVEEYWGKSLLGLLNFNKNSEWYWASAGKTLTATAVGLAQQEGHLSIEDFSAQHLGSDWATFPDSDSDKIKIKHQLTMTTGFNYTQGGFDCTDPECLIYDVDPGQQWYYHNAPYTLLQDVVTSATGIAFEEYLTSSLADKIGMKGHWIPGIFNNVYYSTARDAARYGLFILNEGKWEENLILSDQEYFQEMINPSQDINPAYGYLWWLNGSSSYRLPGSEFTYSGSVTPNGPATMISAMGKNGQSIDIVPDENLVVIRFGQSPDNDLVHIDFHNEMWKKIEAIIP